MTPLICGLFNPAVDARSTWIGWKLGGCGHRKAIVVTNPTAPPPDGPHRLNAHAPDPPRLGIGRWIGLTASTSGQALNWISRRQAQREQTHVDNAFKAAGWDLAANAKQSNPPLAWRKIQLDPSSTRFVPLFPLVLATG